MIDSFICLFRELSESAFHRIRERKVPVGRNLWRLSSSTHASKQGQPEQVAKRHVQLRF